MKTYKQLLEENKSNKTLSQVEELDEIKLATVGKIIKHSPKIASAAIGAAVAAHSVDVPKQPVKASYSEFTKKIQKEEYIEESHEELDKHISVFSKGIKSNKAQHSTYKSGGGKINNMKHVSTDASHQDIFNHLKKMGYKKTSGYDPKPNQFDMHHNSDTMTVRSEPIHHPSGVSAHIEQEHGGFTKVHFTHRKIKEEVESLDELSKKTLGSYVKKATGGLNGVAHHAFNANEKIGRDSDDRAKSYSKAVKRIKGIEQATDKLTKEEVESLDEISAKTLDSYRAKAFADNDPKNQEKRTKGRHLAFDKMVHKNAVKVPATNEEVELDEVLDPSMGAGEYVKDFQKSDAPQFKGKSQEKRRIMGIAAYMAAKREKNK